MTLRLPAEIIDADLAAQEKGARRLERVRVSLRQKVASHAGYCDLTTVHDQDDTIASPSSCRTIAELTTTSPTTPADADRR